MPTLFLRRFCEADFAHLMEWVGTADDLAQWCAAFFTFPLDEAQLRRYLDSATQPLVRDIFTATTPDGAAVGHIELSMIWPHLSCRLSRVLVAPQQRGRGVGSAMVARAVEHAVAAYHVARVDLGVASDNLAAIRCYEREGFAQVGTWPGAIEAAGRSLDVLWMTRACSA